MIKFAHFNFNVLSLNNSIAFYDSCLSLKVAREINNDKFKIVYLEDEFHDFQLELTELFDRDEKYDLGEAEFHLAFVTDQYEYYHDLHKEMGVICFENKEMGIYFIEDPDGYWIEIIPSKVKKDE